MAEQIEHNRRMHTTEERLLESSSNQSLGSTDFSDDNQQDSPSTAGLQRKVTNPFRLRQMARAKAAAEEGINQELSKAEESIKEPAAQPPPKAVFTDLQSAHQSITARNARVRAGTTVTRPVDLQEPQQLQQNAASQQSYNQDFSIKPPTLLASRQQAGIPETTSANFEDVESGHPIVRRLKEQSDVEEVVLEQRPSVLATVTTYFRSALVSVREPYTTDTTNQDQRLNQSPVKDGSSEYPTNGHSDISTASFEYMNRLPHEPLSLPAPQFSSSPAPTSPWLQTRPVGSGTASMEGSTVGEIYRQYEARSPLDKPASHPAQEADSQESGVSSYGDSEILLRGSDGDEASRILQSESEDQLAPPPKIQVESARSENALSVAVSTVPSLTEVNWRHRYSTYPDSRLAREESIKSMYSERGRASSVGRAEEVDVNRLPLERDISQELRRASAISEESYNESIYEGFQARNNVMTDGQGNFRARRPLLDDSDGLASSSSVSHTESDSDTIRGQIYQTQPPPSFYNQNAIAPQWVGWDQEVRVPISRPEIPPRSPLRPVVSSVPGPSVVPVTRRSQDEDEWQTIGGSAWENESRGTSSHGADTSGDSCVYRLSNEGYGSTERIAQHPAPIAGCSNFLRRDVSGNRPVLLPVHNQYLVNGFPANSSRVRPPQQSYQTPAPLGQRHENPFGSDPPEVLSPNKKPTKFSELRARARNLFPPSNSTLTTTDSGTTAHRSDSRRERDPLDNARRLSNTTDWMRYPANFMADPPRESSPRSATDNPETYEMVQPVAKHESVQGNGAHSSKIFQTLGLIDGPANEPADVIQVPRRTKSRDAPAGEFKYRSPLAPPKARIARQIYTEDQLLDIEQLAGLAASANGRILSSASQGPSQRRIDEAPALNTFVPNAPYLRHELAWNRGCLAFCCFVPPLLLVMFVNGLDKYLHRWTKGKLVAFREVYKWAAVYAFFFEGLIVAAIVIGIRKPTFGFS